MKSIIFEIQRTSFVDGPGISFLQRLQSALQMVPQSGKSAADAADDVF